MFRDFLWKSGLLEWHISASRLPQGVHGYQMEQANIPLPFWASAAFLFSAGGLFSLCTYVPSSLAIASDLDLPYCILCLKKTQKQKWLG